MPRLNNDQRNQAIEMLWTGTDVDQVAGSFGVHKTTIPRLQDKFTNNGSVKDSPKPVSEESQLQLTAALLSECFEPVKSQHESCRKSARGKKCEAVNRYHLQKHQVSRPQIISTM